MLPAIAGTAFSSELVRITEELRELEGTQSKRIAVLQKERDFILQVRAAGRERRVELEKERAALEASLDADQRRRDALKEQSQFQQELNQVLKESDEAARTRAEVQLSILEQTLLEQELVLTEARDKRLITEQQFQSALTNLEFAAEEQRQALIEKTLTRRQLRQRELNQQLDSTIKSGLTQSIASVGAALVKGENAFQAFGSGLLNLFGDLLIQIGTATIGIGKAVEAIRNSVIGLFGGQAIAAGIALIALGGALKAFSSGAGGAGTTTGGAPAAEVLPEPIADAPAEEVERSTSVTVNVEGTVIDPVTTGTQIAQLLRDITDSNDIAVNV